MQVLFFMRNLKHSCKNCVKINVWNFITVSREPITLIRGDIAIVLLLADGGGAGLSR